MISRDAGCGQVHCAGNTENIALSGTFDSSPGTVYSAVRVDTSHQLESSKEQGGCVSQAKCTGSEQSETVWPPALRLRKSSHFLRCK